MGTVTPKGDICVTSSHLSASVQATDTNLSCAGVVCCCCVDSDRVAGVREVQALDRMRGGRVPFHSDYILFNLTLPRYSTVAS